MEKMDNMEATFGLFYTAFEAAVTRIASHVVQKEVEGAVCKAFEHLVVVKSFDEMLLNKMKVMIREHEGSTHHPDDEDVLTLMRGSRGTDIIIGVVANEIDESMDTWADNNLEDRVKGIIETEVEITVGFR